MEATPLQIRVKGDKHPSFQKRESSTSSSVRGDLELPLIWWYGKELHLDKAGRPLQFDKKEESSACPSVGKKASYLTLLAREGKIEESLCSRTKDGIPQTFKKKSLVLPPSQALKKRRWIFYFIFLIQWIRKIWNLLSSQTLPDSFFHFFRRRYSRKFSIQNIKILKTSNIRSPPFALNCF